MKTPIVVAELGINHNGDYGLLKKLTFSAFENGADLVKLQLRTPRLCVPKSEWDKPREWFDGSIISYIEYKERMELTDEQLYNYNQFVLDNFGERKWFASVWDIPSLEKLTQYDVPFIKIPSALITDLELVQTAIDSGHPIIISTGMSTEEEIDNCVKLFPNGYNLTILSCTSTYPCKDEEINLKKIETLKDKYGYDYNDFGVWNKIYDKKFGFSSHSVSPLPAYLSSFFDIDMIEVHFTIDRAMKGTDHSASMEPNGLKLIARESKRIPILLGDGAIKVYNSELSSRAKLRPVTQDLLEKP